MQLTGFYEESIISNAAHWLTKCEPYMQKSQEESIQGPGMRSNRVTVTKFLQLLMILELYLELSYILSQIFIEVTNHNWSNWSYQVHNVKVTVVVTKLLFEGNFPIPENEWRNIELAAATDVEIEK